MEALILPFSTRSILCGSLSQALARSACVQPFSCLTLTICSPTRFKTSDFSTSTLLYAKFPLGSRNHINGYVDMLKTVIFELK